MVHSKHFSRAAALVLAAATTAAFAQPQQQSIPDAPRPQTLPDLRTITPVAPATPEVPATTPAEDADKFQTTAPGTKLPAAPESTETQAPVENAGDAPPQATRNSYVIAPVQVNLVEVPFIVKDSKGQQVPGITWRDVKVFENNRRMPLAFFTSDPFPLSVAIVIDQSVTDDTMARINTALGALQGSFAPSDEIAIYTYNNGVRQQTVFSGAQSARVSMAIENSKGRGRDPVMPLGGPLSVGINKNGMPVDPNTTGRRQGATTAFEKPEKEFHTLYDAVLAAAVQTTKAERGRRRIVYVISDGKEYGSKAKQAEVIKYCLTNKIAIWGTLVGDSSLPVLGFLDRIHLPFTMRDNALTHLSVRTAGQLDSEFSRAGIEKSFVRIASEARNAYTLAYYSHEPLIDGKYRTIDVRVERPGLQVIAKEGYWPTAADSRRPAAPVRTSAPATTPAVPAPTKE